MNRPTRICVLDLNNDFKPSLKKNIETSSNLVIDILKTYDELASYIKESKPKLILIFLKYLDSDAKSIISQFKKHYDNPALLCILSVKDGEEADELMKLGIDDFIIKPFSEFELLVKIRKKVDTDFNIAVDNTRQFLKEKYGMTKLIGADPAFAKALKKLRIIARIDMPVLLLGETGTGKKLFARAIHYLSSRENRPFIPVNCGAIPNALFETELFGHFKVDQSDASVIQKGYIAEAEGGILFLDEIDAMPEHVQLKLLHFIKEHRYKPHGATESLTGNVRIIAASNVDFMNPKININFRKILLSQLNAFSITIPTLRERKGDIPILANHFIEKYSEAFQVTKKAIAKTAIKKLMRYDWPGNVRELENIIQNSIAVSKNSIIRPEDIFIQKGLELEYWENLSFRENKTRLIEQFERNYMIKLMADCDNNIKEAVKAAQITRKHFDRIMNKYNILTKAD